MMDNAQQPEDPEQALKRAIWDANEILAQASTIPKARKGTLTITRAKLVAEKRSAFGAADVMSVLIEDVLNVNATVGPISGYVKIDTKFTDPHKPFSIGPFHRHDTIELKRIAQGYVIALKRNINVNSMPTNELRTMLYELGTDDHSIS